MSSRARLLVLVSLALAIGFGRDALLKGMGSRAKPAAPASTAAGLSTRAAAAAIEAAICTTPQSLPRRGLFHTALADPFSLPQRESPRAPPAAPVVAVVPSPPPPPAAPRLPYRYYGTVKERGLPPSVFLALGGSLIQAKAGDVLEGGYRLESIAPHELVFVHLQQNLTLRLGVDGESTWP